MARWWVASEGGTNSAEVAVRGELVGGVRELVVEGAGEL